MLTSRRNKVTVFDREAFAWPLAGLGPKAVRPAQVVMNFVISERWSAVLQTADLAAEAESVCTDQLKVEVEA